LFRFICAFYLGRLGLIAAAYEEQSSMCRSQGDLYHEVNLTARLGWILALMADQPAQAHELVVHAMDRWAGSGYHLTHWYRWLGQVEVPMYRREAAAAWYEIEAGWQPYQASALPYLQICHIVALDLRARAALTMAADGADGHQTDWLAKAERDANSIEHEKREFALVLAGLVYASVAATRQDKAAALQYLESVEEHATQVDMAMHLAAARYRRGQLLGGPEGDILQRAACAAVHGQRVANPPRWLTLLTPGPWE
jgi:hypothetical protein